MKEPVVVAVSDDRSAIGVADSISGWKFLFLIGAVLTIVGGVDIGLLFVDPRWASLEWEFGAVTGFFDGQTAIAIGIALMSAAAAANGWLGTRRVLMIIALLMAIVVAVLAVVLALDIPAALKAAREAALKRSIKMAALKYGIYGVTYFVLYLALGVWTWRRMKVLKGAKG